MRWIPQTLLCAALCGVTACALYRESVQTVHKAGRMFDVYSGTGTNLNNYVQTARINKQEWHKLLVEFWPHLTAGLLALIWAFVKAYRYEPSKHKRRDTSNETV